MNAKQEAEKECKQCPHVIGGITERDCCFPDCVGGWETAYKQLSEKLEATERKLAEAEKAEKVVKVANEFKKSHDDYGEDAITTHKCRCVMFEALSDYEANKGVGNE